MKRYLIKEIKNDEVINIYSATVKDEFELYKIIDHAKKYKKVDIEFKDL